MKQAFALAAPLSLLLFANLAACEDSTNTEPTSPDAGPINIDAGTGNDAGQDSGEPLPSKCPEPMGAPIEHNKQINADETWGPGIHDVTFDVSVRNATLTIEPCAVIRTVGSRGLSIGFSSSTPGKLVAKGKADLPIVFQEKETGKKWSGILVNPAATIDLAYVTVKDGGNVGSSRGGGALHLLGDGTKPVQFLATVDHVTIENSAKYGAVLESHGAFSADSHDLVIKGSGDMPMRLGAAVATTLPTGTYTGNTVDAFRLWGSAGPDTVEADATIHDRGLPYVIGGDGQFPELNVANVTAGAAVPLLTIEAGVTLKFAKQGSNNSGFFVERASITTPARGALRILGTAQKPVILTSNEATPVAGDWVGIVMRGIPDPRNKIEYARIEYAGADTGSGGFSCGTPPSPNPGSNEAAIAIYGQPSSVFITNTTISNSAANGIERAWVGTPMDFLTPNTFTNITWCKQTFPRPSPPAQCPMPIPCD